MYSEASKKIMPFHHTVMAQLLLPSLESLKTACCQVEEEREWTIIFGDAAGVVGISLFSMMNEGKFSMDYFSESDIYRLST